MIKEIICYRLVCGSTVIVTECRKIEHRSDEVPATPIWKFPRILQSRLMPDGRVGMYLSAFLQYCTREDSKTMDKIDDKFIMFSMKISPEVTKFYEDNIAETEFGKKTPQIIKPNPGGKLVLPS